MKQFPYHAWYTNQSNNTYPLFPNSYSAEHDFTLSSTPISHNSLTRLMILLLLISLNLHLIL